MSKTIQSKLTPLFLFAMATMMMGLYAGLYEPSFNNYLMEVHQVSEVARGGLEFPRELPGFLVVFILTLFLFLPDARIAAISAFLVGIALWGQGFLAPGIGAVVVWMLVWSTGAHLFMVVSSSIGLRLALEGQEGRRLGQLASIEALGTLLGMILVYIGATHFHFSFGIIFGVSGSCALIAAISLLCIKAKPIYRKRQLILKKQYTLFYLLNILFGARKQIFLTFAPWVLIKVFHADVGTFAILGFIGTVLSLFFRPLLGHAIDALGEKTVLAADSVILILICILYAFAEMWFSHHTAMIIIMSCFVIDYLLFAVRIARTTYLNRILEEQNDLAPTISMGLTMDHAVSMIVPFGGGLLWAHFGYLPVFLAAAGIAVLNLIASLAVPDRVSADQQINTVS